MKMSDTTHHKKYVVSELMGQLQRYMERDYQSSAGI
jgi:hypothetical protein